MKREAGEIPARTRRCIKFPFAGCHCPYGIEPCKTCLSKICPLQFLGGKAQTGDYFKSEDLPDFHAHLPRGLGCLQE